MDVFREVFDVRSLTFEYNKIIDTYTDYSRFRVLFSLSNPLNSCKTLTRSSVTRHVSHVLLLLACYQTEYVALVQQCMNFACELMDLCRGTQELEAVLGVENEVSCDPLARLRLAIQYNEKKASYQ